MRTIFVCAIVAALSCMVAAPQNSTKSSKSIKNTKSAAPKAVRFEWEFESKLGFQETIDAIKQASADNKYSVLAVHEVSKILTEKGFARDPMTIIEICNAKLASDALKADVRVSLMMPCPVVIHVKDQKVKVLTFDVIKMASMYEGKEMKAVALKVDQDMRKILSKVMKN